MQTKAACKPWLHANHGWPTLIPYDVRIISDGLKQAKNTPIWWGWVKMGEKWSTNEKLGLIFWGKVQDGIRSMPLYRCFQRANFDTPHGHHEFRMQFWPTRTDSHAVSHFKELWVDIWHMHFGQFLGGFKAQSAPSCIIAPPSVTQTSIKTFPERIKFTFSSHKNNLICMKQCKKL